MQAATDLPSTAPLQRWDTDGLFDPQSGQVKKVYTRFAAYLSQLEDFDAEAFRLSRAEALPLDPHARFLLEHTQVRRSV